MRWLLVFFLCPSLAWAGASRFFDGDDDLVTMSLPTRLVMGTDDFTQMHWFFWTNGADPEQEVMTSQKDFSAPGNGISWISIDDIAVAPCSVADQLHLLGNCGVVTEEDVWHHAAVRYQDSTTTSQGVYDGVQVASGTLSYTATTGDLMMGRYVFGALSPNFYGGNLAFYILCEGFLTDAQINEIRFRPASAIGYCGSNLLMWMPLQEASSTNVVDLSGYGNNGTQSGGIASSDNGPPLFMGNLL